MAVKTDSDNYVSKAAQTVSRGVSETNKSKSVQVDKPPSNDKEVNVSRHAISDAFATPEKPIDVQILERCTRESQTVSASVLKQTGNLLDVNEINTSGPQEIQSNNKSGQSQKHISGQMHGHSTKLSSSATSGLQHPQASRGAIGRVPREANKEEVEPEKDDSEEDENSWVVQSEDPVPAELGNAVRIMERIVSQNVFHRAHMTYRNYPTLEQLASMALAEETDHLKETTSPAAAVTDGEGDLTVEKEREEEDDEDGDEDGEQLDKCNDASLTDLFTFERDALTKNLPVTCAEWNAENKDLLAVSYGNANSVTSEEGLVLFWSLKNPNYPERVLKTNTGVTSLSFSNVTPNLVSAGMHDGTVAIWDLRKASDTPVLESEAVSQNDRTFSRYFQYSVSVKIFTQFRSM